MGLQESDGMLSTPLGRVGGGSFFRCSFAVTVLLLPAVATRGGVVMWELKVAADVVGNCA